MLSAIFERFNLFRKKQYFGNPLFRCEKRYAFVGVGMHSLTNLYPVLRHFNIDLKYICTKTSSFPELGRLFPGTSIIHDYDAIIADPEVTGIFICADPREHFGLVARALTHGKMVFVDKPPCQTSNELENLLTSAPNTICKVGLQRRYWPANKTIIRKVKQAQSYTYRFHTGPFLQGDVLTGLFIHHIDYALYIFGDAVIRSHSIVKDATGTTIQLHLMHSSGIPGFIECSTQYSWNAPLEEMHVNCSNESLKIAYPTLVEGTSKPKRIGNIPSERLFNQQVNIRPYFSANNLILPVQENNTLFLQGFYGELEHFLNITEGRLPATAANDLKTMVKLYGIFDQLRAPTTSL